MVRTSLLLAWCALPQLALAQANGSAQQQPPQYQPAYPPPQTGQAQPPPQAQAQPPPPPPPQQQPATTAPPQATGTGAAPSGSQQVVVNPPPAAQQQPPPPAPAPGAPATAVTVNPPAGSTGYGQYSAPPIVVQQERQSRSSLEIVAIDAAYGALAGLLVGGGVALIANNDDWGRDLMIGTGAGILVGAAVGGIHAYNVANSAPPRYARAGDGLGTPDRNPPLAGARTLVGYAARF